MVGAGTYADPRRPLFAPLTPSRSWDGIIAFSFEVSDDGRFALVEFVARSRRAFQAILADRRLDIRVFEKGRHPRAQIEAEFRKHKKNIDLDRFGMGVQ